MQYYLLKTELGPFVFAEELDALNFMIDVRCGKLPIETVSFEDTKYLNGVWLEEEFAVIEYNRRKQVLKEEVYWLKEITVR